MIWVPYTYFPDFQNRNPYYQSQHRLIRISTFRAYSGRVDAIHQDVKREKEQWGAHSSSPAMHRASTAALMDVDWHLQRAKYAVLELNSGRVPQRERWGPPHALWMYASGVEYLVHPLPVGRLWIGGLVFVSEGRCRGHALTTVPPWSSRKMMLP